MFRDFSGFYQWRELSVDVGDLVLFSGAERANDDETEIWINSVDDSVGTKLVFPITGQRGVQFGAVALRVHGKLLQAHFFEGFFD